MRVRKAQILRLGRSCIEQPDLIKDTHKSCRTASRSFPYARLVYIDCIFDLLVSSDSFYSDILVKFLQCEILKMCIFFGGESQRLKLVKHLLKEYRGNTVYFLDEPTVWLHPADIERLLKVLKRFLEKGDTILMIEHDEDILQFADHVIKLDQGKLVK